MTILEAQDLAIDIRLQTGQHTDLRQIGNGEWVVWYNYTLFVWDAADWERIKYAV